MAKCPKCKNRLNFWDTIFLSRLSNRLICKSCETVLEANKSALSSFGVSSTILFLTVIRNGKEWFGIENPLITFGIGLVVFIGITVFFFYQTNLSVSNNQDKSELIDNSELKEKPILPNNYTRTEYLKNKFHNKSDKELESIAIDSNRIPEAHKAASQILLERKNVA